MENFAPIPDTINRLRFTVDAAFAMLAGMQLDLFTPLKASPMTAEQIASAIGVKTDRLRLLLWSLVAGAQTKGLQAMATSACSSLARAVHRA